MTEKINTPFPIMKSFEVYESKNLPYKVNPMTHFALTDALVKHAGMEEQPILHFWTTEPLAILGMMDTKLPKFQDALPIFNAYNHQYIVRNSGGLAVVSDPGVLNISLIFPEESERLPINAGYDRMHQLIETAFSSFGKDIIAKEIPNSYCPGEYDLSIEGKKIAGISQRRIKGGVAVMIYLSVNGDQDLRANMIRDFYERGLNGEHSKWHFPTVQADVMTTLEKAFDTVISVQEVKKRVKEALTTSSSPLREGKHTDLMTHQYLIGLEKMEKRNRQLLKESYIEIPFDK